MKTYIKLDENGFCEYWSSCYMEGCTEFELIDDYDFLNNIRKYKYDGENFVYDETKAIEDSIKQLEDEVTILSKNNTNSERFEVTIDLKKYYFDYTEENKNNILQGYLMISNNILDTLSIKCYDEDDNEILLEVNNIQYLAIVTALANFQNKKQKDLFDLKEMIRGIKTIEELKSFRKEYGLAGRIDPL